MAGVLVLNADLSPLEFVDWERAVCLLLSTDDRGVPRAIMFEAEPGRAVHSPSLTIPMPRTVQLVRYQYLPHARAGDISAYAAKRQVLGRDRRTCAYCGGLGVTVDHVFLRSRGGGDSWDNLVAACHGCNNRKADRTPDEARMPLLWTPWRPDRTSALQAQVWQSAST